MDVLVMVANRRQKLCDVVVVEAIVGVTPGPAHGNQPRLPKEAQLM
jgi:hypothetical protein